MTRKKIVAGNWKMNTNLNEGKILVQEILQNFPNLSENVSVIIAPPFTHLSNVYELIQEHPSIQLAAQNCHYESKGAFTGEISPKTLTDLGVKYVILGHSERREYFNEDENLLSKKINAVLDHGMSVIYCIGEKLASREANEQETVVAQQLSVLSSVSSENMSKIILAYEPVWAIGTGKTATSQQAQEMHAFIRQEVAKYFNDEIATSTTILYGGSCNAQNADELFSMTDVDGGLIGGAALKSADFISIIEARNK